MISPEEVLALWFGEEPLDGRAAFDARMALWFGGDEASDLRVREALGGPSERALEGAFDAWAAAPRSRLALILLLDQVPRNVHRETPRAFAGDARAYALAEEGIERLAMDRELSVPERLFFNMPRGHSEEASVQERAYAYLRSLYPSAPPFYEKVFDGIAKKHVEVARRFGRFPQRNATLGRASTPDELAYLEDLKRSGARF